MRRPARAGPSRARRPRLLVVHRGQRGDQRRRSDRRAGEYTDTAGDLGPPGAIHPDPDRCQVRGEAGKPRPRIVLEEGKWLGGAFDVNAEDVVAHLEITTAVASGDISQFRGTVEDLIVRNTAASVGSSPAVRRGDDSRHRLPLRRPEHDRDRERHRERRDAHGDAAQRHRDRHRQRRCRARLHGVRRRHDDGGREVGHRAGRQHRRQGGRPESSHTPGTGGHVRIKLDHSAYGKPP